jgi:hypothetical protein
VQRDTRSYCGQRVRRSHFIVSRLDPAHDAETPYVVDVDQIQPKEPEICEIDLPTVFMGLKVNLSCRNYVALKHRFDVADQGSSGGAERITIFRRLRDE